MSKLNYLEEDSQNNEQLPQIWDSLTKRLNQVERSLAILTKKHTKIDKKLQLHAQETVQLNSEITEELLRCKQIIATNSETTQKLFHKKSCNEFVDLKIQEVNTNLQQRMDSVELKIRPIWQQTKNYVDRAVFELKQMLKKYVKDQGELEGNKIERSYRDNSPSLLPKANLNKSQSAKKIQIQTSKLENSNSELQNSNLLSKSRGNLNKQPLQIAQNSTAISGSRVSYLRQKLREFQKINKKFDNPDPKQTRGQDVVKKMKNYKQYLQQSQSQIETSNIMNSNEIYFSSTKKCNNEII